MKKMVNPLDYASRICKHGILLTTKADGKINTMTIGWGQLGFEWGKDTFVAYIRDSRYTRELLDQNGEFTVNVPLEAGSEDIIRFCGSKSGRDVDKIKELGLTLEDPEVISVPGIRQLPLTLECRVIYRKPQNIADLPKDIVDRYYNAEGPDAENFHIAYYGEIVSAYIIE